MSLPFIMEDIVGREQDISAVIDYIKDDDVHVVSMFGLPGVGKTSVALHVGHIMRVRGMDVHFIRVGGVADIAGLEVILMKISSCTALSRWARALNRSTLLILDEVDGHWLHTELHKQFQASFVQELLQNSKKLKVLITSRKIVQFHDHFRSYLLEPFSTKQCIVLFPHLSLTEAEIFCQIARGVPASIRVFLSLLQSPRYREIIAEVKMSFHSALRVAFDSLIPEHQMCSLLLAKFSSLHDINFEVISGTIKDFGYKDFQITHCLNKLYTISFLEHDPSQFTHMRFHVLVRDFLKTSAPRKKHDMPKLLSFFWKNILEAPLNNFLSIENGAYASLQCSVAGKALFFGSLKTDQQMCSLLLAKFPYEEGAASKLHNDSTFGKEQHEDWGCLYNLSSQFLTDSRYIHNIVRPVIQNTLTSPLLQAKVISSFFWNCSSDRPLDNIEINDTSLQFVSTEDVEALIQFPDQDFNAPKGISTRLFIHYFVAVNLISYGFTDYLANKMNWFLSRVDQVQLLGKGDHEARDVSAVLHSSLWPLQTNSTWKSSLFVSIYALLTNGESAGLKNGSEIVEFEGYRETRKTLLGFEFYSLKEDEKALYCFYSALQNTTTHCKELHDAVVYIALYDIYSRHEDRDGMNNSVSGVNASIRLTSEECNLQTVKDYIVTPFLHYVNEIVDESKAVATVPGKAVDTPSSQDYIWRRIYGMAKLKEDFQELMLT